MIICQCCKQPIQPGQPYTANPAPKPGGTWYIHRSAVDCALALLLPELRGLRASGERRAA